MRKGCDRGQSIVRLLSRVSLSVAKHQPWTESSPFRLAGHATQAVLSNVVRKPPHGDETSGSVGKVI